MLVLGGIWLVVTGLVARSHLDDARAQLTQLRAAVLSGNDEEAARLVDRIRDDADTAHRATSGPAWWTAANIPGAGAPLRTTRVIAAEADRLGDVLPGIVELRRTVSAISRGSLTSVDLPAVARAVPRLTEAARVADRAYRTIAATDGSWLSPVSSARTEFETALGRFDGELTGADRAARIAVPMLGAEGKQRYFIGFLNEAESRGAGGIPGAFAIATADRGRIAFETFGSDDDLAGVRADVDLGAEFTQRYQGSDPLGTIQNSDLSPDFGYTARIWAGMWEAKTGERIDGAMAVDPTALSYLLRATGGATLPDGSTVSADNVVALTQQQQYARFPGLSRSVSNARKLYLTGLATSISTHLTSSGGDAANLIKAVSRAAGERRFVVWSRYAQIERQLTTAGWSGELGNPTKTPYSGFVVNNSAGSKLDYYLRRRATYQRTDCGAGGRAVASFTMTNTAPASGLPAYVTYRADKAPAGAQPGDTSLLLTYYADRSARIEKVTVAGRSVPFVAQPEGNTIAVTTTVELRAGRTVTATVEVAEPRASGPVTVLRQPGVQPLVVDTSQDRCR